MNIYKSKKLFNNYNLKYYITLALIITASTLNILAALKIISAINANYQPQSVLAHSLIMIPTLLLISVSIYFFMHKNKARITKARYEKDLTTIHSKLLEKETLLKEIANNFDNISSQYSNRTDFFINITHEMKAPLSVILGAIQLLEKNYGVIEKGVPGGRTPRYFSLIRQNCFRLIRLVNNILDISRLQSGYMNLNLTNCNIVYLTEEITQSIMPYAEQKSLTVEFDTEQEEIITAVDVEKMERILLNLLSNAIKFSSSKGKIQVRVQKGDGIVTIHVSDSGPGIPQDKQSVIFERYKQIGSNLTRSSEGTGIGLAIVKAFIELQGGNIKVSSKELKGSTFSVELPLKLCDGEKAKEIDVDTSDRIIDAVKIELSDIYTVA